MTTRNEYPAWLTAQSQSIPEALARAKRIESAWVWTRLSSFVLLVGAWLIWMNHPAIAIGIPIVSLVLFWFLAQRHRRAFHRVRTLELRREVLEESSRRVGGNVVAVRSNQRPADLPESALLPDWSVSDERWTLTEQERDDLDLYAAPVGVFGLLNRCSSALGSVRLRDALENPSLDAARIRARQQTVRWLSEHPEARIDALSALAWLRGTDPSMSNFLHAVVEASPLLSRRGRWFLRIWSLLSAVLTIAFIALSTTTLAWLLGLIMLLLVNDLLGRRIHRTLRPTMRRWELSESFAIGASGAAAAWRHLPQEPGSNPIREALRASDAPDGLGKILSLLGWITGAGMVRVAMNLIVFHDVHIIDTLTQRTLPRRQMLLNMVAALGEIEVLLSLACVAPEDPRTVWSEFDPATCLTIQDALHPLLPPPSATANTLSLNREKTLWVITGSNMSGKSTFLRTLGVNVVLAQMGGAAWARSMRLPPVRLMTDLRVRDNLSKGESYFLAEVRQLGRMLSVDPGAPVLGLVDEPLRGTNHQEQHAATVALVEHLSRSGHWFVLATHDQTISTLVDQSTIEHHHFSERIVEGKLSFDYRLRPGPSRSRNALSVLQQEGFPAALVERARQIASEGP